MQTGRLIYHFRAISVVIQTIEKSYLTIEKEV